jgi:hypothetical protein
MKKSLIVGRVWKINEIGKDEFGFTFVKGSVEVKLESIFKLKIELNQIQQTQKKGSTLLISSSSRSCCIFLLKLVLIPFDSRTRKSIWCSSVIKCLKLIVVDFVGSERVLSHGDLNQPYSLKL